MGAGVVERLDPGLVAHDEDRLIPDAVLEVAADLGDLFFAASHLPEPGEESLVLELQEFAIGVATLGHEVFAQLPALGNARVR